MADEMVLMAALADRSGTLSRRVARDRAVMNMVQRRDGSNLVGIRTVMPDRITTDVPLEGPDRGRVPGLGDQDPNAISADTHLLLRSGKMPSHVRPNLRTYTAFYVHYRDRRETDIARLP